MLAPDPNRRLILAHASGDVIVRDESEQKRGLIRNGGVLDADILPEEIGDSFTLALRPNAASMETASAIADQINEDVSPQTNGKPVAKALDGTTVDVQIPRAEQTNKTAFIARIRSLPLPNMPEPARVVINRKTKTIIFTEEVELAPTMISHGGLTITVTAPGQDPNPPGTQVPFVVLNTRKTGTNGSGMAKLRDLEAAFNLLKVSPDDRIAIVELLYATNVLKCTLDYE